MENTLHYLLMADHSLVQKRLFAEIKELNLSLGQPKVLDYLFDNDGAVQKEIACGCHIEPASLSSILVGMEKKGLVRRSVSESSRRSTRVYMTEYGKEIYKHIRQEFEKIEQLALSDFSDSETKALISALLKISKNLEGEQS